MKNYTIIFILLIFILVTCKEEQLPEIEINHKIELELALNNINGNSASITCNLMDIDNVDISEYGLCWNTTGNPTIDDYIHISNSLSDTVFNETISQLEPETDYYVKGFITINGTTIYGDQIEITTTDGLAVINTLKATDVTDTTAISGGKIIDNGGYSIISCGICWSSNTNPTILDHHYENAIVSENYISNISGLNEKETYYVRAYATNINGTSYGNEIEFFTGCKDFDGNIYETVKIGNQVWMAENLKTTHYANGTEMILVTNVALDWDALSISDKAYCYYWDEVLYNWAAAMNGEESNNTNPSSVQGVCPDGWHLPSDNEWTELINFISSDGQSGIEGTALKSTEGWYNDGNGTDLYGFNALPTGMRSNYGQLDYVTENTYYWSATQDDNSTAWYRSLFYGSSIVDRSKGYKNYGFSVRCIKD